jgi:hypothetical protein
MDADGGNLTELLPGGDMVGDEYKYYTYVTTATRYDKILYVTEYMNNSGVKRNILTMMDNDGQNETELKEVDGTIVGFDINADNTQLFYVEHDGQYPDLTYTGYTADFDGATLSNFRRMDVMAWGFPNKDYSYPRYARLSHKTYNNLPDLVE